MSENTYFRVSKNDSTNLFEIAEMRASYTRDKAIEIIKEFHNYIYNKEDNKIFWDSQKEPAPMFATVKDIELINGTKFYRMGTSSGQLGPCNFMGHCNGLCGSDACIPV